MAGPGWHMIGEEEIDSVMEALRTRELSRYRFNDQTGLQISKVCGFEREFGSLIGSKHCLAVNSCTSALLAGLTALGIGPGDEVIVPGFTFIASIAAVAHARATPVLAEIDESLTIDPLDIERKITRRTKAIMPVHMLGAPSKMNEVMLIARRHGLFVIEDVAQACGGSYGGRMLGSIGDIGAFSLNTFKTITAGDGGALVTDNDAVYERAFAFHDHGFRPFRLGVTDEGSLLGMNLRMNELVGAVALAQARKMQGILSTIREKKAIFKQALAKIPNIVFRPLNDPDGDCASTLVLLFRSKEVAAAVASAVGGKTLLDSGRHYYGSMIQLTNRNMPTRQGCPFDCPAHPTSATYEKGSLPFTDEILGRAVGLSVGVSDNYLCCSFGINILSDEQSILDTADEFIRRTAGILH
jgi:dTDP-4-amino-4,6-dideoxygalactose transaminase